MAETAVTSNTETRTRRRFDVWNEVPLVPQLTGMSCWAAAAAMVVGWRDRVAADPRQVARGAGSWQAYAGGLRPADVQTLARAWGLVEERRDRWTVDALRQVLERHGPVWLGEASPGLHSIVVVGMHGDGTPDGTWVRVNDPWPVGRGERYTLPWRTFSANYRAAGDLIGMQAHVLHAGGRRGSSHTRSSESRVTRSHFNLPLLPGAEDPMSTNGNGRPPHAEDYASAYGSPLAVAASTSPAGERYLDTATRAAAPGAPSDPLRGHGGTGDNLYLAWNEVPDNIAEIDVVVHLHGYKNRDPDAALTRIKVAESGLRLAGRTRPTLAILPRGRRITPQEVADARARKQKVNPDRYTFPALTDGSGAGLEALVRYALDWFNGEVLLRSGTLGIGRMILTAHSGGGSPLERLLGWRGSRRVCNPEEVHVFDGLYNASPNLEAWAQARIAADAGLSEAQWRLTGGGCRIVHRDDEHGTGANSRHAGRVLATARGPLAAAYRAELTSVRHDEIPGEFGPALLGDVKATLVLHPRRAPASAPGVAPPSAPHRPTGRGHALEDAGYTDGYTMDDPAAEPAYGYVEALAVDDDVRAWLAARAPADRAPYAAAVRAWIADTARSGIELVPDPARRRHFLREVDWTRVEFPRKGSTRAGESEALFNALAQVVPERRVTGIRHHPVDHVVQPVPGQTSFRLHPAARDAFVRMRDAARADGVELHIYSAWRSREQQRQLAAQNPNGAAVAQNISAHEYGLAVDLRLAVQGLSVGNSTQSMTNVVALYRSPVYKWMALHGREHGWFPYRREPWHWEYNPLGFGEIFEREAQGAAPGQGTRAQAYGAPLGLFERYPAGALDAAPAGRIAVPYIADARPSLADAMQAPAMDWCALRQTIAANARREEARWRGPNGTRLTESSAGQLPILQQYWQAVPGFADAAAALNAARRSAANELGWEWSAAFICFVMHASGVRRAHGFEFAARHMNYIVGALRNRERSDTTRPFWLVDHVELAHEATLEPGDLLCYNRPVRGVMTTHTYDSLRRAFWENGHQNVNPTGSSHTALVVAAGQDAQGRFVQTIGGNESGSVLLRRVALDANGGIPNAQARRIFGLIKMTGCNR
jgi:D-alanyl-D-alanine dipeptidase